MKNAPGATSPPPIFWAVEAGVQKKARLRQDGPAHARVKLQVGHNMGQDGARWAPKGPRQFQDGPRWPKVAQVGPKMEQEGGKMGTKKGQEGAKEAQVGPKMGQEGGKMGTQRGQEDAREAQVGPKSGQKKRDPKINVFFTICWACFRSRFGLQAFF